MPCAVGRLGALFPALSGLGLELATVSNLKASIALRPRFDTRHHGTNLSFMQNTVEIEQAVIIRPVRINTHTALVFNTHDFMFAISTLSSLSFILTVINRMMETHREKYYANYSPT